MPAKGIRIKETRDCPKCGGTFLRRDWPRYARNGFLTVYCADCNVVLASEAADAKTRVCTKCKARKPYSEFDKHMRGRVQPHCKQCRWMERLIKGLPGQLALVDAKIARDCKRASKHPMACIPKPLPRKTPEQQREENRLRSFRKYQADPSSQRLRAATYKHANPHKVAAWGEKRKMLAAAQSDGTLTRDVVCDLFGSAKFCPYCGVRFSKATIRTLDHLDPISTGGVHGISNVAICCRPCNVRKNARPFSEWLTMLSDPHRVKAERLYRSIRRFAHQQQSLCLQYDAPSQSVSC